MSRGIKNLIIVVCIVFIAGIIPINTMADDTVNLETIIGVVNDDFQIVTDDNTIYEVEFSEEGEKLVEQIGKRVEVSGMVESVGEFKSITVDSFKIIE